MTDIVDKQTRSRMMSGIRGRDTKPERIVRKYLHRRGLRYRIAPRDLPGKPDIVLPRYHSVVFVHGCFWHRHEGCRLAAVPASNPAFWQDKFEKNVARDKLVQEELLSGGWRVFVIWECETREDRLATLYDQITGESR